MIDRGLERIVSIVQVGNDASERITLKPACGWNGRWSIQTAGA
jgi:hypothetical protein